MQGQYACISQSQAGREMTCRMTESRARNILVEAVEVSELFARHGKAVGIAMPAWTHLPGLCPRLTQSASRQPITFNRLPPRTGIKGDTD